MAHSLYYGIGSALVKPDELEDLATRSEYKSFVDKVSTGQHPSVLQINDSGSVSADEFRRMLRTPPNARGMVPFEPIGLGRPLIIRFENVYTGKLPKPVRFAIPEPNPSRALLITSAVKSCYTYEGAPRAMNGLLPGIGQRRDIVPGVGTQPGTQTIFYSPALRDKALSVQIEMKFQDFDQKVFSELARVFNAMAGSAALIPPFHAAIPYMILAGGICKIAGEVGKQLLTGSAQFSASTLLNIELAGHARLQSGYALVTHDALDPELLNSLHIDPGGKVVDAQGKDYRGELPHAVISFDGTKDQKLEQFQPTAASAALLGRFYNEGGAEDIADRVIEAIRLYGDFSLRREFDEYSAKIESTDNPRERKKLKAEQAAISRHIQNDIFRPTVVPRTPSQGHKKPKKSNAIEQSQVTKDPNSGSIQSSPKRLQGRKTPSKAGKRRSTSTQS